MTPSAAEAPMTQPPRKCAVIGIPNISPQLPPGGPRFAGPTGARPRGRRATMSGSAHRGPAGSLSLVRPKQPLLADMVSELSRACMTRAITVVRTRPAGRGTANAAGSRAAAETNRTQPGPLPSAGPPRPPSTQSVPNKAHHVGTVPVPDRLDMRPGLGVKRRGYCHAAAEIRAGDAAGDDRAQKRLRIGPRQLAEPGRQPGQLAPERHRLQQPLGAERAGSQDDLPGRQNAPPARPRGAPRRTSSSCTVPTSQPPPGLGSTERTVVSGTTTAPARSARWR